LARSCGIGGSAGLPDPGWFYVFCLPSPGQIFFGWRHCGRLRNRVIRILEFSHREREHMRIHVVQRGDTLWSISQRYKTTISQIELANQLENPDALAVGQALVIPEANREYIVQPGDTLWMIAQRYGTTVQTLAQFNRISNPALIYAGQMIQLPAQLHAVQQGETLWLIAQRYGTTVDALVQANDLENPDLLYPGQVLWIPAAARPGIEVNAYTTTMDEAGRQEVLSLGNHLTYLTPFSYTIRTDGSITSLYDTLVLQAAQTTGTVPLLVLTNFAEGTFQPELAAALLRNPQLQETLLTNLLELMSRKNYRGVNFDFEYVLPEDRENYNAFLRRSAERLRPLGYTLSTSLAPKTSGQQRGVLYEAHDYETHGEIADFVILMTYEWGWVGGPPWAIAPINEVKRVLDYAVTAIPRNKILMGMPLYARDWNIPFAEGTFAQTISPQDAIRLAIRYGAAIQYDETYQAPFFRYVDENGRQHEVWFEDARSVQAKFDTVKEYGLRGISYWVLGNPFPQNWLLQQSNFLVRKIG